MTCNAGTCSGDDEANLPVESGNVANSLARDALMLGHEERAKAEPTLRQRGK